MADTTPVMWLAALTKQLDEQRTRFRLWREYVDGKHRLEFVTAEYRAEFAQMIAAVCDNWMPLVVDSVAERLKVEGFRLGDDPDGDKDAWDLWQRCNLDADSSLAHETALEAGLAFAIVWYGENDQADITIEDPEHVTVAYAPGSRRVRAAALKLWCDDVASIEYANVYLPDGIYKFQRKSNAAITSAAGKWKPRQAPDDFVPNPLKTVPVVQITNRQKLKLGTWRSEIADVVSTQDQINKLARDLIVASEFAAFRQRWASGISIPLGEDGKPIEDWQSAIDRLWHTAAPDAHFGDFAQTDLGNYIKALENRVQSLASRTRTPPHYLLGQSGSFPSGESLKATETGLIAKVRDRQTRFGEAWEEVIRLAFLVQGDARAEAFTAETIWADPESRTEAEHVDALVKKLAIGVPVRQLWEDAGYSQTQIDRFRAMAVDQALVDSLRTPVAPLALNAGPPTPPTPFVDPAAAA